MKTSSILSLRSMLLTLGALLMTAAFEPSVFMQQSGGGYTLYPTVIPGGGGASTNGTTRIEGSIGQSVVDSSSLAPFTVNSGFWPNAVPCPFNVAPRAQFFTMRGGTGSINVITPGSFCNWATTVTQDWIVLTSKESGSGNEVINFEVRENFTGNARQTSINVSGLSQVVVQDAGLGQECNYAINPKLQTFSAFGGTGTINVTADVRCAWQAVTSESWITITSTNVGIGNGTVAYTISPNPGLAGRNGTIIIGGKAFSLKQKGD